MERDCLMGIGLSFRVSVENVLEFDRGDGLHNFVNTTELYTLKCLVLCCVNFLSIKSPEQLDLPFRTDE